LFFAAGCLNIFSIVAIVDDILKNENELYRASINYNDECVRKYKETAHSTFDVIHSRQLVSQDEHRVARVDAQTSTEDLVSSIDDCQFEEDSNDILSEDCNDILSEELGLSIF